MKKKKKKQIAEKKMQLNCLYKDKLFKIILY